MHEMRIAKEIIEVTYREMTARQLSGISEIGLKIGILSGISSEALRFSFEAATAETPLSKAELKIELTPIRASCNSCQNNFVVDDFVFICPGCGSKDIDVIEGQELSIAYFIGE